MISPRFISDLLGAPMAAIVQAEAIAARATADFIKEVGFTKPSDASDLEYGNVRNITFNYSRNIGGNEEVVTSIEVPLLTIVSIPMLKIAEAEIEFDLVLSQPDTKDSSSNLKKSQLAKATPLKAIFGKKPQAGKPQTTSNTEANMNVKIKLAQSEPTIGVIQLLNILEANQK
ncbi:DUF2589 domain-containing protein [Belliella aquatica]|uniref:DUF2589 domain-containing protein n=1 Tax=Belliella aquatica TaxID=1323734 RepID=A0ABQ1MLV3_9BACT|nr:DUF2589 domain-containing protein [Belliella aquatica]MCH7405393.1 DUF2589 domain-containing protein [Belliella aquatica]GGC42000.1 hypothetical protein GCM10010993_20730 [Belliella aquatica]